MYRVFDGKEEVDEEDSEERIWESGVTLRGEAAAHVGSLAI